MPPPLKSGLSSDQSVAVEKPKKIGKNSSVDGPEIFEIILRRVPILCTSQNQN